MVSVCYAEAIHEASLELAGMAAWSEPSHSLGCGLGEQPPHLALGDLLTPLHCSASVLKKGTLPYLILLQRRIVLGHTRIVFRCSVSILEI